jgi:hypothetical protein
VTRVVYRFAAGLGCRVAMNFVEGTDYPVAEFLDTGSFVLTVKV